MVDLQEERWNVVGCDSDFPRPGPGLDLYLRLRHQVRSIQASPTRSWCSVGPDSAWRSLGPLSKLSVFVGMFLNTTVPFAVGLSGVSYGESWEHRGVDCDISELFPRMLKSSLLLIPMFLVSSFPWMIAHAFFFYAGRHLLGTQSVCAMRSGP